ncbi:TonB-dependent receptor [uncultured Hyphomonas sp.]|uniref:TonB-dependent receptor n=1 Tax=uncultured Hyphomonas sp. TaxID=225298 RepID=UPI002AABEBC3|nr:TonB-dependent receptor [uncultured Hyphomonas sp.]
MKKRTICCLTVLLMSGTASGAWAQAQSEVENDVDASRRLPTVLVESQRTEEYIQDVPISVTALDTELLDLKQVDAVSDLQFNAPNVNYTKTFFSGSNFQIRGIGSTLTAASADSGVAAHVNDVYIQSPRLFETEYYDLERVEVLRGPQGTLFGRNATGGAINMITAKPLVGEFAGKASFEYGNFNSQRTEGMLNVPLGDTAAVRVAGLYLKRDGFAETVDPRADFDDFDDRDIYSIRGSLRFEPTINTSIDLVASYFEEDDSRTRATKSLCDYDPTAVLGCTPTGLDFDSTNFSATLGGLLMSDLALGPFGAFPFNTIQNNPNPPDFRKAYVDEAPEYYADETFIMAALEHDFGKFRLNANIGRQETEVSSNGYGGSPAGAGEVIPPALVRALLPVTSSVLFDGNRIAVSGIDPNEVGYIGGNIFRYADGIFSYDQSDLIAEQTSFEVRLSSQFEGPLNFTFGYYNLDYENQADYYIFSNSADYASALLPTLLFGDPANGVVLDGVALGAPYFHSDTDRFKLESSAIFGEAYWTPNEEWTVTLGLRSTTDKKSERSRTPPLIAIGPIPIGDAAASTMDALLDGTYRELDVEFDDEITGRIVVDWKPNLNFTDETLVFGSYSRGYKSGGFNPPVDPAVISGVPTNFAPEQIDAFEVGTKNTIGAFQANMSAFYYDYKGLQVGKIQARTSINENVDAEIWGLEGEFLWAPTEKLLLNLTASYLNTEVTEFSSEDPRDPTAGEAGHILIKDTMLANNCVLTDADPVIFQTVLAGLQALSPTAFASTQLTEINGLQSPGLLFSCNAQVLGAVVAGMNLAGDTDVGIGAGVPKDLSGNSLQNSPEYSFNLGGQYTFDLANGMSVVARTDYYYQDKMYASIYNSPTQDTVDAWDVWNAQITLNSSDDRWYVRGFVQNILDDDSITGHYIGDQGTGLATTVFALDPRLYGVELGIRF